MTKLHTDVPGGTIPLFVPSSMKRLRSFVVQLQDLVYLCQGGYTLPGVLDQDTGCSALLVVLRLLADSDLAVV